MKRFVVTLELYVYADSEGEAIEQGKVIAKELDTEHDNKAECSSAQSAPFGTLNF